MVLKVYSLQYLFSCQFQECIFFKEIIHKCVPNCYTLHFLNACPFLWTNNFYLCIFHKSYSCQKFSIYLYIKLSDFGQFSFALFFISLFSSFFFNFAFPLISFLLCDSISNLLNSYLIHNFSSLLYIFKMLSSSGKFLLVCNNFIIFQSK